MDLKFKKKKKKNCHGLKKLILRKSKEDTFFNKGIYEWSQCGDKKQAETTV